MSIGWRGRFLVLVLILGVSVSTRADIVILGSFGPNGDLGFATSPLGLSVSFGPDGQGSISQLDAFASAQNANLGSGLGVGQELSTSLPAGMSFQFTATQPTNHQLLLDYQFVNTSGQVLNGFQFSSFADADIGPNFVDESASMTGVVGNGRTGSGPTSFQVGDPTYSSIFTNLLAATLSNVNEQPGSNPGDVSTAMGFSMATVGVGQKLDFKILMSDDGTSLGGLAITQTDPVDTTDRLTLSGVMSFSVVPEPASIVGTVVGLTLGLLGVATGRRVHNRFLPG